MITFINYYDVWGNKKDGFEVNDVSMHTLVGKKSDLDTPYSILRLLKKNEIIKKTAKTTSMSLEFWDENEVEITCKKTGMPVGRLLIEEN